MSISKEIRIDYFIDSVKEDLKSISYPQQFSSEKHEYTNCMAYAIGAKTPDYNQDRYYPGGITRRFSYIIQSKFIERMIQDLEFLGISCTIISEEEARTVNQLGKQIIAVYYAKLYEEDNFHIIRKDKSGTWSHKPDYKGCPVQIEYNYERFLNHKYELLAYLSLSFN